MPKRREHNSEYNQSQTGNEQQQSLFHKDDTSSSTSPYANDTYTVGWICALPIEVAAAKGMMDEEHGDPQTPPHQADQNTYLLGRIGKFRVVIACLPKHEVGASSAAAVARDMLHAFPSIRVGLLVGIGAGIPDYKSDEIRDIRLGDVVISSDKENGGVVLYDFGKKLADGTFKNMYALNRPPRPLRTAMSMLEAEHQMRENKIREYVDQMLEKYPYMRKKGYDYPGTSSDQLFRADYSHVPGRSCEKCDAAKLEDRQFIRRDLHPVIHYGVIATGSAVVKHAPTREEIGKKHRAICLEMEAAGLMNHFPSVVIRGISDYGDSHKNDQWQPYAAATSAACAKELLQYIQPRALEELHPAKDVIDQILNDVSKIGANVEDIKVQLHKNEDFGIFNWLTPIDYGPRQSDFLAQRQEGTGQWLLNSDKFQDWFKQSRRTLFCPGFPGAGKTILTSTVVDYLCKRHRSDTTIGIAYLYCNFQRQDEQKVDSLLANLLKQLAQGQSSLPVSVKDLYHQHKNKQTRPSLDEISRALQPVAASYSKVFIVVDALDECQVSKGCRSRFLSEIFSLQATTETSFFATSRPIPDIERKFTGYPSLEIVASDEDVRLYLDGHMSELPGLVLKRPWLQEEIKREITKAVDGMFLLAQLYLASLQDKTTVREVQTTLKELKRKTQGELSEDKKLQVLAEAYDYAMERINGQRSGFRRLAVKVLYWITCAKRPLRALELQYALAVNTSDSKLDEENLPDIGDMISVCAGLVTVDEESNIIRLVHYTTHEYFEQTQMGWFPDAQNDIATTCITYLSFDAFEAGLCLTDEEFKKRLQQNPLYDYAAQNWGNHVYAASTEVGNSIPEFLKNEAKVSSCNQAMMMASNDEYLGIHNKLIPMQVTAVHLAAWSGLAQITTALIENGYQYDCRNIYGRTPLFSAAENGHLAVVRLLIEKGADLESKDNWQGITPLYRAAWNGHEAVVRLLAENGADLEFEDNMGRTPLYSAAVRGHEAVARLLVEKGVDLESKSDWSPLEVLVGAAAMVKRKDKQHGVTPLFSAARYGHEAVVKLLIEKNVDVESKDDMGGTPLFAAAENGHEAVVKLLIEKNVDVESKDDMGRTPLFAAAENGHEAVVKLLIEKNVDGGSKDNMGRTPLFRAAENGHEAVIELLLGLLLRRDDVEVNSKNKYGRTALLCAAENGYTGIVKLLLARDDVEVNSRDRNGQTPLSWAAQNGHEAVVELLLRRDDIEINSNDEDDDTPLSWAVQNGHEGVVKLLLTGDAIKPYSQNLVGRTPLSWAEKKGYFNIVELLEPRY